MELLLIVLVLILLFGGYRTYNAGGFALDVVGMILVVLIALILISMLTPLPYHYRIW